MLFKLGIAVGILALGGMIFSTEIENFFPTTSSVVIDSIKNDISGLGSKTTDSVEARIDSSLDKIINHTNDSISHEISEVGAKVSEEISVFDPVGYAQGMFVNTGNLLASHLNDLFV